MKIKKYLGYIIPTIALLIYLYISTLQTVSLTYISSFIYILLIFINVYLYGKFRNEKEIFNCNINYYIFIYAVFIGSFVFLINRSGFGLIDFSSDYLKTYIKSMNLIPFKYIIFYLTGKSSLSLTLTNVLGNFFLCVPLCELLIQKDETKKDLKKIFIIALCVSLCIELLQFLFSAGYFDVDDLILNSAGSVFMIFLMNKYNLHDKIKKILNTTFIKNNIVRIILYIISLLLLIAFSSLIIIECFVL